MECVQLRKQEKVSGLERGSEVKYFTLTMMKIWYWFSDLRLFQLSFCPIKQIPQTGSLLVSFHMRNLTLHQGRAQVELRSHVGTGLGALLPEDAPAEHDLYQPLSCQAHLAPERLFPKKFTLTLTFLLCCRTIIFCFCFLQSQRLWLSSCGMCALGETGVIHHCQEIRCMQQASSHLPLLLQRGLQILKRCITCTLQTAIHH